MAAPAGSNAAGGLQMVGAEGGDDPAEVLSAVGLETWSALSTDWGQLDVWEEPGPEVEDAGPEPAAELAVAAVVAQPMQATVLVG